MQIHETRHTPYTLYKNQQSGKTVNIMGESIQNVQDLQRAQETQP